MLVSGRGSIQWIAYTIKLLQVHSLIQYVFFFFTCAVCLYLAIDYESMLSKLWAQVGMVEGGELPSPPFVQYLRPFFLFPTPYGSSS